MKEYPILFTGPMVRAILDGRKTQTRRAVKPQPTGTSSTPRDHIHVGIPDDYEHDGETCFAWQASGWSARSPYGAPGDRLWAREAWARTHCAGSEFVVFREGDNRTDYGGPWKPGIHLRRADARLFLEVTAVRVERLLDISEQDAIAEGVKSLPPSPGWNKYTVSVNGVSHNAPTAREVYAMLWDTINGPGSWDANPWVWVVEFKRIEP